MESKFASFIAENKIFIVCPLAMLLGYFVAKKMVHNELMTIFVASVIIVINVIIYSVRSIFLTIRVDNLFFQTVIACFMVVVGLYSMITVQSFGTFYEIILGLCIMNSLFVIFPLGSTLNEISLNVLEVSKYFVMASKAVTLIIMLYAGKVTPPFPTLTIERKAFYIYRIIYWIVLFVIATLIQQKIKKRVKAVGELIVLILLFVVYMFTLGYVFTYKHVFDGSYTDLFFRTIDCLSVTSFLIFMIFLVEANDEINGLRSVFLTYMAFLIVCSMLPHIQTFIENYFVKKGQTFTISASSFAGVIITSVISTIISSVILSRFKKAEA